MQRDGRSATWEPEGEEGGHPPAAPRGRDPNAVAATAGAACDGERGEVHDERGVQRRREETTAVWRTMPSNTAPSESDPPLPPANRPVVTVSLDARGRPHATVRHGKAIVRILDG
ncbi:MAG: hypothetical protein OXI15_06735 [Chromatiales bacterium]|nr:hypothetical protein [Chromatiales bacterium]